jgi:hypothetical protein
MDIMHSLKIGYRDVPIILIKPSPLAKNTGAYDPKGNVIYLEDIENNNEFIDTLFHEILHVLVDNAGLNTKGQPLEETEETVISSLSNQLTALFVDNKPLLLYLYAKLHNFKERKNG